MIKKIYKIIIVPYTLFLLYLMFWGMGRFQYEENLITVEPVFSTIKYKKIGKIGEKGEHLLGV